MKKREFYRDRLQNLLGKNPVGMFILSHRPHSIAVTIAAYMLSAIWFTGTYMIFTTSFLIMGVFIYACVACANLVNLLTDMKEDRAAIELGLKLPILYEQSPFFIKMNLAAAIAIALASSYLVSNGIFLAGFAILLSILYSVPPFRVKNLPIVDSVFSGLCFGGLPVIGAYLVFGASMLAFIPTVISLTLFSMAAHFIRELYDYEADKKTGNRTTTVYFGRRATATYTLVISIIGLALFLVLASTNYLVILTIPVALLMVAELTRVKKKPNIAINRESFEKLDMYMTKGGIVTIVVTFAVAYLML